MGNEDDFSKTDINKPKVVWWIDHLGHGGSQVSLVNIVKGISPTISCHVVVLNNLIDPKHLVELESAGVRVWIIGKLKLVCGIGLIEILWRLRREKFNVAVTFLFYSDVLGTILSRLVGIKMIISSQRSTNVNYQKLQDWILSKTLALSNIVVLNCGMLRAEVSRYLPESIDVRVIRTGIRLDDFSVRREGDIREELQVNPDTPLIGVVGRLSPEKGLDTLVCAISSLKRKDSHLAIVGSGSEKEKIEELVMSLGISERVHMLGHREDVYRILSGLDVYIQASTFEGLPMALLESVAANCPVVTTPVGGIIELIPDDRYGWIVPIGRPEKLTEAIDQILCGSDNAFERASQAKKRLATYFSYEAMVNGWKRVITTQHIENRRN